MAISSLRKTPRLEVTADIPGTGKLQLTPEHVR